MQITKLMSKIKTQTLSSEITNALFSNTPIYLNMTIWDRYYCDT